HECLAIAGLLLNELVKDKLCLWELELLAVAHREGFHDQRRLRTVVGHELLQCLLGPRKPAALYVQKYRFQCDRVGSSFKVFASVEMLLRRVIMIEPPRGSRSQQMSLITTWPEREAFVQFRPRTFQIVPVKRYLSRAEMGGADEINSCGTG